MYLATDEDVAHCEMQAESSHYREDRFNNDPWILGCL